MSKSRENNRLFPCECGASAEILINTDKNHDEVYGFYIGCNHPKYAGEHYVFHENLVDAIAEWNTRYLDSHDGLEPPQPGE